MKRLHVHVAVSDLDSALAYYNALFGSEPTVLKPDYAKWRLDDPRMNFSIARRGARPGVDHLGIEVESEAELGEVAGRLAAAQAEVAPQKDAIGSEIASSAPATRNVRQRVTPVSRRQVS